MDGKFLIVEESKEQMKILSEYECKFQYLTNTLPVRDLLSEEVTNEHDRVISGVLNSIFQNLGEIEEKLEGFMNEYYKEMKNVMMCLYGSLERCYERGRIKSILDEVLRGEEYSDQTVWSACYIWSQPLRKNITNSPTSAYNSVINEGRASKEIVGEMQKFFKFIKIYLENKTIIDKERLVNIQKEIIAKLNSILGILYEQTDEVQKE
ncbi:hypothetical protein PAEPH01_0680 [Pancytospora epiphaga]|nr:hypothetical protein PAEPH01_0680 [Pancytospora epiphaga]